LNGGMLVACDFTHKTPYHKATFDVELFFENIKDFNCHEDNEVERRKCVGEVHEEPVPIDRINVTLIVI
jgi:hypothetical protein